MISTRTTLYLSPSVRSALKERVADTGQTMSEYVDEAVALAIAEDLQDIETIEKRKNDPIESLDSFLAALKSDSVI